MAASLELDQIADLPDGSQVRVVKNSGGIMILTVDRDDGIVDSGQLVGRKVYDRSLVRIPFSEIESVIQMPVPKSREFKAAESSSDDGADPASDEIESTSDITESIIDGAESTSEVVEGSSSVSGSTSGDTPWSNDAGIEPAAASCQLGEEAEQALANAESVLAKSPDAPELAGELLNRARGLARPPYCDDQLVIGLSNRSAKLAAEGEIPLVSLGSSAFVTDTGCEVSDDARDALDDAMIAWRKAYYVAEASQLLAEAWYAVSAPGCDSELAHKRAREAEKILEQDENRFEAPSELNTERDVNSLTDTCGDMLEGMAQGGEAGGWLLVTFGVPTTLGCFMTSSTLIFAGAVESKPKVLPGKRELLQFIHLNQERLAEDIARGQGEYLASLGVLKACSLDTHQAFDAMLKDRFEQVFTQSSMAPDMLVILIEFQVETDDALAAGCGSYW